MIKQEELKVGMFVWWRCPCMDNRGFPFWSCPCLIIEVYDIKFKIKTLDDHNEFLLLYNIGNRNILSEMEPCSIDEVRDYFKEEKTKNFSKNECKR
jgi:hypothetical protein